MTLPDQKGRPKKKFVEYRAAHIRVDTARGKSKEHDCVDCGGKASEWSLSDEAQHVHYSREKDGAIYSLNVYDYQARCRPCHRKYDGWSREVEYDGGGSSHKAEAGTRG